MNNDISTTVGHKRVMSFFDGKVFYGITKSRKRVYIDKCCAFRYEISPSWGKDFTPVEFQNSIVVVSNKLEASLVMKNDGNYWSGQETAISKQP